MARRHHDPVAVPTSLARLAGPLTGGPGRPEDGPNAERCLSPVERHLLYHACGRLFDGRRDSAILALLDGVGRTPAEAAAVDLADVDLAAGTLRVRGADGAAQPVGLLGPARVALDEWLKWRQHAAGPLVLPLHRPTPGRPEARLSAGTIEGRVHLLAVRARLPWVTTAALRRTCVADLRALGAPVEAGTTGWNDPATRAAMARRPVPVLQSGLKQVGRIAATLEDLVGRREPQARVRRISVP